MYRVNISIDDISPHPRSSVKVLDQCYYLIDKFPGIKFTIFVPMAYKLINEESYRVDEYPEFCEIIKSLPEDKFEIGWHGYYHDRWNEKNKARDREFRELTYEETGEVFSRMYEVAKKAGIIHKFKSLFRPPAFKISQEAIRYCNENEIELADHTTINVNPPHKPLELFGRTEMLYHACEWDKNYMNDKLTKSLESFLRENIENIDFVFKYRG
jgi:predicted deacetylase